MDKKRTKASDWFDEKNYHAIPSEVTERWTSRETHAYKAAISGQGKIYKHYERPFTILFLVFLILLAHLSWINTIWTFFMSIGGRGQYYQMSPWGTTAGISMDGDISFGYIWQEFFIFFPFLKPYEGFEVANYIDIRGMTMHPKIHYLLSLPISMLLSSWAWVKVNDYCMMFGHNGTGNSKSGFHPPFFAEFVSDAERKPYLVYLTYIFTLPVLFYLVVGAILTFLSIPLAIFYGFMDPFSLLGFFIFPLHVWLMAKALTE
jgi:hypothetical protein